MACGARHVGIAGDRAAELVNYQYSTDQNVQI